jgi:hypothetical protein
MSTAAGNNHQGIFMENGSGGVMTDLVFNGGKFGIWVGNQQFTVRNVTVNNAATGVFAIWNWGWTFQGITINNCQVGFDITTGGNEASQAVGAEVILDSQISNTPIAIRTSANTPSSLAGSLLVDNLKLTNVATAAITTASGNVLVSGGTKTIAQWAQGNIYTGTNGARKYVQAAQTAPTKPSTLLDSNGRIFTRPRPQYESYSPSQFISVKSLGAKGDGQADDTAALQAAIDQYWGCKIIYFDAGTYLITNTLKIPAGAILTGEMWPVIMATGSAFSSSASPKVAVQVGTSGSTGTVEISDIVFSTRGPAGGAIVVEWNVHDPSGQKGVAGMWDVHIRLGGTKGTNLQGAQCVKQGGQSTASCSSAYLGLHLTSTSSAYLENVWVWNADHDLDDNGQGQISLFSGRGILSESTNGPIWMVGTASEHHVLYQYNIVNSKNVYMGLIQTETPYFQPTPGVPSPFSTNSGLNDPSYPSGLDAAWALRIKSSSDIYVYGAGLYNFFRNYNQDCLTTYNCQTQIVDVDSNSTGVHIYSLSTVASQFQISVNEAGVVNQADNRNGFASTVTIWNSAT